MGLSHTKTKRYQQGLASLEAALIFTFIFLIFIIVIFQSVKVGYVSMDRQIAARNSAWKKEIYFPEKDGNKSLVNVVEVGLDALGDEGSGFVNNRIGSVHKKNVIGYAELTDAKMQKRTMRDVLKGLDAPDTNTPTIKLRDITKITEDFNFKGVKGTGLSPDVPLLSFYANREFSIPAVIGLLQARSMEALISFAGLKQSVHHTDFQAGWNLPTDESPLEGTQAAYEPGGTATKKLVYEYGYDNKLKAILHVNPNELGCGSDSDCPAPFKHSIPSQ